jgi:hypothetical protein
VSRFVGGNPRCGHRQRCRSCVTKDCPEGCREQPVWGGNNVLCFRVTTVGTATLALAAGFSPPGQVACTVTLVQPRAGVVATGSGTTYLADLPFGVDDNEVGSIAQSQGAIATQPAGLAPITRYSAVPGEFTGPAIFGVGHRASASSGIGDMVGRRSCASGMWRVAAVRSPSGPAT